MKSFRSLTIDRQGCVFIITLNIPPENRLNLAACREVTEAFHEIQRELGPSTEGAVITRGSGTKYWCTVGFTESCFLNEKDADEVVSYRVLIYMKQMKIHMLIVMDSSL